MHLFYIFSEGFFALVALLVAGMASTGAPTPLPLRNGIRIQPDPTITVETALLAVGDIVGHINLIYASRMNKGVGIFLKEERFVTQLSLSGVTIGDEYLQVSPLAVPSTLLFRVCRHSLIMTCWKKSSNILGSSPVISKLWVWDVRMTN